MPLSVFPVTLANTFPHKIRAHSLFDMKLPLQSWTPIRSILPPKRLYTFGVPIDLSCNFSVRTYHKGTLKPKVRILTNFNQKGPYLRTTPNVHHPLTQLPGPNTETFFGRWWISERVTPKGDHHHEVILKRPIFDSHSCYLSIYCCFNALTCDYKLCNFRDLFKKKFLWNFWGTNCLATKAVTAVNSRLY